MEYLLENTKSILGMHIIAIEFESDYLDLTVLELYSCRPVLEDRVKIAPDVLSSVTVFISSMTCSTEICQCFSLIAVVFKVDFRKRLIRLMLCTYVT